MPFSKCSIEFVNLAFIYSSIVPYFVLSFVQIYFVTSKWYVAVKDFDTIDFQKFWFLTKFFFFLCLSLIPISLLCCVRILSMHSMISKFFIFIYNSWNTRCWRSKVFNLFLDLCFCTYSAMCSVGRLNLMLLCEVIKQFSSLDCSSPLLLLCSFLFTSHSLVWLFNFKFSHYFMRHHFRMK